MKGVVAEGQWASDCHMGLTPSLYNNSAGPCGHFPVPDIFSKNTPSLQPHSCKSLLKHLLSTSETESNKAQILFRSVHFNLISTAVFTSPKMQHRKNRQVTAAIHSFDVAILG